MRSLIGSLLACWWTSLVSKWMKTQKDKTPFTLSHGLFEDMVLTYFPSLNRARETEDAWEDEERNTSCPHLCYHLEVVSNLSKGVTSVSLPNGWHKMSFFSLLSSRWKIIPVIPFLISAGQVRNINELVVGRQERNLTSYNRGTWALMSLFLCFQVSAQGCPGRHPFH